METWKDIYNNSLTDPELIARAFDQNTDDVHAVAKRYPARINTYYLDLALGGTGVLGLQVIPTLDELSTANEALPEDPVGEDDFSPVTNLSHRYQDRVLFLISDCCPIFCRFCTRKRKVGRDLKVTAGTIESGLKYISENKHIRDVLLSGGDPLMLPDDELESILSRLREIRHVEIVRIGTRVPCALPQRITAKLADILGKYQPVYVHTHFNHPEEITTLSREACRLLAEAGVPLNNQTVLLKGINNDTNTLEILFRSLLSMRVRPYYLFQVDTVKGTDHFRTDLMQGIDIMKDLNNRTSHMALPTFVCDLPEGAGKVHPCSGNIAKNPDGSYEIKTFDGNAVTYKDPV